MNAKVDMTYSFLWDEEPSDEQLQVIMEEVAEEARRAHETLPNKSFKTSSVNINVPLLLNNINKKNNDGKTQTAYRRGTKWFG